MANSIEGPLPVAERIATLDIVRGFALVGILIMNMPGFGTSYFVEADGSHLWTSPLDRAAGLIRDMLFSGKFNSMFSLLFGLGFTIQFGRMQQRNPAGATWLYLRRLLVLLGFGALHVMIFWTGDVLHVYAVLGLVLLLALRKVSDRVLWVLIGLCLLFPAVSGVARQWLMSPDIVARLVTEAKAWEASNNAAYGQGSFLTAAREHTHEFIHFYDNSWGLLESLGFYVQMATTMLLGFLIGRHRLAQRIPEFLPQVRRWQWWALGVGILCSLIFGIISELLRTPGPHPLKIVASVAYSLSRLGLMIFYVATIVRLAQQPAWQKRFAPMAAAGRMPLTNYLMQTLICTSIFYGWGLRMWGKVGPAAGLALALGIFFIVQVPWSLWWLKRHDYGPLEWLWRVLTYGHRPAERVAAVVAE